MEAQPQLEPNQTRIKRMKEDAHDEKKPLIAVDLQRGGSKPHWYKQTSEECPVCGKRDKYRERIYGEKPDNLKEIYFHKQVYDHCIERAC